MVSDALAGREASRSSGVARSSSFGAGLSPCSCCWSFTALRRARMRALRKPPFVGLSAMLCKKPRFFLRDDMLLPKLSPSSSTSAVRSICPTVCSAPAMPTSDALLVGLHASPTALGLLSRPASFASASFSSGARLGPPFFTMATFLGFGISTPNLLRSASSFCIADVTRSWARPQVAMAPCKRSARTAAAATPVRALTPLALTGRGTMLGEALRLATLGGADAARRSAPSQRLAAGAE
mmetsp:Transcript_101951/g.287752  ORF Transcript_101951/g.287752 Transcript_101951/m.287752 type:complete len:239 (-) Transcript_101951:526-1242(-)